MKRQKKNLSHYKLLTGDMGQLIPIGCVEVLPGDTFQHTASTLVRVSPLVAPVMHPVNITIEHYFVPNRIIFPEWEDFITGGPDGNDATTLPTVNTTATPSNYPLLDYLGVPPVANMDVSALPVRAYNKIINDHKRDQDIDPEIAEDSLVLQNAHWPADRYTKARPWPQKGDSVTIPLSGSSVDVVRKSNAAKWKTFQAGTDVHPAADYDLQSESLTGDLEADPAGAVDFSLDPNGGLSVDLTGVDGMTIDDFRLGMGLQNYKEARAKFGSRYTEWLRYYGVRSSDARLQRAERLGSGSQTISFSEVLQTAEGTDPVGSMKGHGIAALRSNRYRKYFEEHGFVISLMYARPKAIYEDALPKKFLRLSKEDYYTPELADIGQQEIQSREIFADPGAGGDATFAWGNRYGEYDEELSQVSGLFRTTLDHYHLARDLTTAPSLNPDFIKCVPSKRIHADTSGPTLWIMANHKLVARRNLKARRS